MPDTIIHEKFTFSPARRERVGLAIALAGSSGSGKTKSALEIATGLAGPDGRICVIDTEGRRALHYASQYTFDHLDFQPPYTPERCTAAIVAAQTAGADVVIFDSASDEYEGEGGLQDIHDAEARRMATDRDGNVAEWRIEAMNAPAWKAPKLRHKANLIRRIRSFPGFVIFCLRAEEKVRFEKIKDERTGREKTAIVQAGWIPICEKRFMYDMTLSLTLAPETKGKPRFDLTHKITDDHVPFFPEGQFIGRRAGELLRLWATGAPLPQASGKQNQPEPEDKTKKVVDDLIAEMDACTDGDGIEAILARETVRKQIAWMVDRRPGEHDRLFDFVRTKRATFEGETTSAPTTSEAAAFDGDGEPESAHSWEIDAAIVGQEPKRQAILKLLQRATIKAHVDEIETRHHEFLDKLGRLKSETMAAFRDRKTVLPESEGDL